VALTSPVIALIGLVLLQRLETALLPPPHGDRPHPDPADPIAWPPSWPGGLPTGGDSNRSRARQEILAKDHTNND
jgi:hypothetical protein